MIRMICLIMLTIISLCSTGWSANIQASVDRNQIQDGESFMLSLPLSDSSIDADLSPLKNDFYIYGASKNTAISSYNGSTTQSITEQVTLVPKNSGKLIIPAINIGKNTTYPITINVFESSKTSNSDLFIESTLNSDKTYVGMPVLYTLKLYTSKNISGVNMKPMQIDSSQASIDPHGGAKQFSVQKDGVTYKVIQQQFLITPHKSGVIDIPPGVFQVDVPKQSTRSFFGFKPTKPVIVKSKSQSLKSKPMAKGFTPLDWFPAKAVKVEQTWSNNNWKEGEPVTRTIKIYALGVNSSSVPQLKIPTPVGLNSYPDKPVYNDTLYQNQPLASVTYKIAYIPTQSGKITFDALSIKWFDTVLGKQKFTNIEGNSINVSPGSLPTKPAIERDKNSNDIAAIEYDKTKLNTQGYADVLLWKYMCLLLASIIIFLVITVILLTINLRNKKINENNKDETDKIAPGSLNNSWQKVLKSAKYKKAQDFEQSILGWGKLYYSANIITIVDLAKYINNNKTKAMLNDLYHSSYNGKSFTEFSCLYEQLSYQQNSKNLDQVVKPLYF